MNNPPIPSKITVISTIIIVVMLYYFYLSAGGFSEYESFTQNQLQLLVMCNEAICDAANLISSISPREYMAIGWQNHFTCFNENNAKIKLIPDDGILQSCNIQLVKNKFRYFNIKYLIGGNKQ